MGHPKKNRSTLEAVLGGPVFWPDFLGLGQNPSNFWKIHQIPSNSYGLNPILLSYFSWWNKALQLTLRPRTHPRHFAGPDAISRWSAPGAWNHLGSFPKQHIWHILGWLWFGKYFVIYVGTEKYLLYIYILCCQYYIYHYIYIFVWFWEILCAEKRV